MENYDLIKTVGKGSYGDVNLVSRKGDPKLYVMKVVTNTEGRDDDSSVEAMREVNIMKKFRHPNIVEFTECFFHNEGKNLCIVMGYCECGDLGQQIQSAKKRRKFLRESDIMDWFVQLALALKYLHSHHVLHRDLKPQNVFLTNQYKILKLGDFGITKVLDNTMAQAVTTIGTPYYFSPEICQSRPYGMQSDIWAAGCIIYELMVLQVPFMASNLRQLVQKILFSKPASPNTNLYSKDLLTLVAAMLAKGPERRPTIKKILATPCIRNHLISFTQRYASLYEGTDLTGDSTRRNEEEAEQSKNLRDEIATINPKKVELSLPPEAGGVGGQLSSVEEKGETPRLQESKEPDEQLVSVATQAHEASRRSEERDDVDDLVNLCTRELHLEQEQPISPDELGESDGYDKKIARAPKTTEKQASCTKSPGLKIKTETTKGELGEFGKSLLKSLADGNSPLGQNSPLHGVVHRGGLAQMRQDGPVRGHPVAGNVQAGEPAERHPSRPDSAPKRRPSPRHRSLERKEKSDIGKRLLRKGSFQRKSQDEYSEDSSSVGASHSLLHQGSDFERGMDPHALQKAKAEDKHVRSRTPSFEKQEGRGRRPSPRHKRMPRPSSANRIRLTSIERAKKELEQK